MVSLLAAGPFLLLQALFLRNSDRITISLVYGAACYAAVLLPISLIVYCIVECRYRIRTEQTHAFPSFTAVGAVSLLGFFLPAYAVHPFVSQMPQHCRAVQDVRWETTLTHPDGKRRHRFILVLAGTGTADSYRLRSGYMNWTGEGDAQMASIQLNPIRFNAPYNVAGPPGSYDYLRDRMSNAGLDEAELDTISREAWQVLENAERGDPISARHGVVSSVYSHVDDGWDLFIGGVIWMFMVFAVFQYVGHKTLWREPLAQLDT